MSRQQRTDQQLLDASAPPPAHLSRPPACIASTACGGGGKGSGGGGGGCEGGLAGFARGDELDALDGFLSYCDDDSSAGETTAHGGTAMVGIGSSLNTLAERQTASSVFINVTSSVSRRDSSSCTSSNPQLLLRYERHIHRVEWIPACSKRVATSAAYLSRPLASEMERLTPHWLA